MERDILKSSTGWIDVHKRCLVSCFFFFNISYCLVYEWEMLSWVARLFQDLERRAVYHFFILLNGWRTRWRFVAHLFCV